MGTPTREVERLNTASWALMVEEFIAKFRWQSVILFAMPLMAPKYLGALPFPLLVFGTVIAMAALWTKWRFKLYFPAVWCITITSWSLLAIGKAPHIQITDVLSSCLFGMMSFSLLGRSGSAKTMGKASPNRLQHSKAKRHRVHNITVR